MTATWCERPGDDQGAARRVTLTFDNGPEPEVTPHVLDTLARHNIQATFFVLGRKVVEPARASIAKRAWAEGHRIGNHTFSHTTPLGELDQTAALDEFDRAEEALGWLKQPERLFRPYGRRGGMGPHLLHPAVVERLEAGLFTCVLWNSVPGDWLNPTEWVDAGLKDCLTRPWSLVVLHDLPTGAMAQLDEFIWRLVDSGAEITQEYPPECTPIVQGRIVGPIGDYVQSSGMRR